MTISGNVAYDILGHSIFMIDGTETNNVLENNLVINTKIAWSLLTTDTVPASFWIKNIGNQINGNRAAGSEGNGFWIDLPPSPEGALSD